MAIKNWLVKCELMSPLCGDPPMMCALLEYELAMRMGMKHARKITRDIPLSSIKKPPIPLSKLTLNGIDFYRCSNPIIGNVHAEYTEHQSKRFDTELVAGMLDKKTATKKLLTASGPYKSRYVPKRVRVVDAVYWFIRGDRKEANKLLKKIIAIGHGRGYGYGQIAGWSYTEMEDDNSVFSMRQGEKVLMKTLPIECAKNEGATGYRRSFGGAFSPYWHPETFMEISIPC